MSTPAPKAFDENSASVQGHLEILQGVINRMATNSASAKAWCVSLVAAILVLVGDKDRPALLWIAAIPTLLFLFLDAYYLALEKAFRASYRSFVTKLHQGQLAPENLYEVGPEGGALLDIFKACASLSVWPFYLTLGFMIAVTAWLVAEDKLTPSLQKEAPAVQQKEAPVVQQRAPAEIRQAP